MATYDNKEQYNTLWDRLEPEYKMILDVASQTYPYSIQKIKDELDANIFYIDLTVGCVMSLSNYLNLHTNNLHNLSMLFGSSMYKISLHAQSVDNGIQEGNEYMMVNGE